MGPIGPQVAMLPPAEQQKVLDMVQALSTPSAIAANFAVDGLITVLPSDESKKWLQFRQVAGQVQVMCTCDRIVNYLAP